MAAERDLQQLALNLLSDFRGLEPLRRLFWTLLNYQRVNQPLSRQDWPERDAQALAEDPLLLASHQGFDVIYARLGSPDLPFGAERPVVSRLLKQHPYALFVFSNAQQDRWHFLNVKYDAQLARRNLYRRITVAPGEQLRTATERLSMLDIETFGGDLSRLSALEIQARHDEAFDVERVTKKFFEQYGVVFHLVERLIRGIPETDRKRLFTQRLFNRLMFIAFIQKKGWLRYQGDSNYLSALRKAYARQADPAGNFYRDRLQVLFFAGLNTEVDVMGINRGAFMKELIGDVPYLNGGLFEEDEDDRNPGIVVPDEATYAILHELLDRFNFTVTESTPLDVEVAVDPEMLGKVFEELVTGRHETGSYYTPKPVVAFMGREALKGYLQTQLPTESSGAIERFVEERDPTGLRDPEAVLEALRRVTVCDPACGSGAYLLGMLHELLELRAALFATKQLDPLSTYQRKLEIIQNNLYGVDLDPFAVNIARLRLWLSLAVDFDGPQPLPLPNLDFKIEVGDSLLAPDPGKGLQVSAREHLIEEYLRLKARFMTAHGGEKQTIKGEIERAKQGIELWTHGGGAVVGFDWPVEFAEVFVQDGFDIVLANPPYVRADAQFRHIENEVDRRAAITNWKAFRQTLQRSGSYQTLYEKWDLYVPFLERGYQLLRPGGRMVFIIPDAYNAAKYARKSHEFFLRNSRIERIDFCTDIPLFEAGVSNTVLRFAKVSPTPQGRPLRVRRWGEKPDDFEVNLEELPTGPQLVLGGRLFRTNMREVAEAGKNTMELGQICYISYGLRANADERYWRGEFVTDDVVSNVQDQNHPKPFIEGKDIVRWWIKRIRFLEWGTERAPHRFARPTFPELHEAKGKLIALVVASGGPPVMLDEIGLFTTHTSCIFVPWHRLRGVRNKSIQKSAKYRDEVKRDEKPPAVWREELEERSRQFSTGYLLAVMNSTYTRDWLAGRRRSNVHVYPDDWKPLPIPVASDAEQAAIAALVDQILALYTEHGYPLPEDAASKLAELEQQIDERVARLYGLGDEVIESREVEQ